VREPENLGKRGSSIVYPIEMEVHRTVGLRPSVDLITGHGPSMILTAFLSFLNSQALEHLQQQLSF
jgi:hypothetical protein